MTSVKNVSWCLRARRRIVNLIKDSTATFPEDYWLHPLTLAVLEPTIPSGAGRWILAVSAGRPADRLAGRAASSAEADHCSVSEATTPDPPDFLPLSVVKFHFALWNENVLLVSDTKVSLRWSRRFRDWAPKASGRLPEPRSEVINSLIKLIKSKARHATKVYDVRWLVHSVPGIMGRNANVVAIVSAALMKTIKQFDPDVIPIPWNEQVTWNCVDRLDQILKFRPGYFNGSDFSCSPRPEDCGSVTTRTTDSSLPLRASAGPSAWPNRSCRISVTILSRSNHLASTRCPVLCLDSATLMPARGCSICCESLTAIYLNVFMQIECNCTSFDRADSALSKLFWDHHNQVKCLTVISESSEHAMVSCKKYSNSWTEWAYSGCWPNRVPEGSKMKVHGSICVTSTFPFWIIYLEKSRG